MKRRSILWVLFLALAALAVIAIACDDDDDEVGETPAAGETPAVGETPAEPTAGSHSQILADVEGRGQLICGVNDGVPGFGFVDADGTNSGFDTDFCRAIAAAVLGDATAVQFVPLTAEARLTALQTGQIDVLIRNTTWTITRDAATGLSYAVTTFYDGQGMMVRVADGFDTVDDLAGSPICVLGGTTTELNLFDRLPTSDPIEFEENETLQVAFIEEACVGWTSDKSQLASRRSAFPEDAGGPDSLVILDETFSKEPLGPLTIDNDSQWFDIVNWVTIGMIIADEKGITSENIDAMIADPPEVEAARLLGVPFEGGEIFDPGLGIDPAFMQEVIRQVGNYGEVYTKNIDPIGIPRAGTLNASFTDGGLIYAPPWR